jgi:tetratricopeptide (TPR) repeat protein
MAIKGSLKEASLPDVLQLLSMGKKTGCLGLSFHDSFGSIYFDSGRICHAAIVNRPLDTENAVYTLFTWTSGTFNFEPNVEPEDGAERVSVDPQSLLLEGARRVDEWSLIEKKIPSFDVVFSIDRSRLMLNRDPLSPEQEALLPLIDGHRDINGLIRDSGLGEFEVGKALYGLLNASFLLPVGRKRTTPTLPRNASPIERRELASALYRAGMHDEAQREFRALVEEADDPVASFHLGLIALREKEWAGAVNAFMTAAPHAPSKTSLLHNLALAYEQLGQLGKARLLIERALGTEGSADPLIQLEAAVISMRLGDLQSAKVRLSEARSLWAAGAPPAVWFHYAAQVAVLTDDPDREMLLLAAAIESHPESPVLLNNLAAAHLKRGDFAAARDIAEKGIAVAPELPQLRRNLATALEGLSHTERNAGTGESPSRS